MQTPCPNVFQLGTARVCGGVKWVERQVPWINATRRPPCVDGTYEIAYFPPFAGSYTISLKLNHTLEGENGYKGDALTEKSIAAGMFEVLMMRQMNASS